MKSIKERIKHIRANTCENGTYSSFFKHACATLHWDWMFICYDDILYTVAGCVFVQWPPLWGDCADVQARIFICWPPIRKEPKLPKLDEISLLESIIDPN